jgi:hypothetical protein
LHRPLTLINFLKVGNLMSSRSERLPRDIGIELSPEVVDTPPVRGDIPFFDHKKKDFRAAFLGYKGDSPVVHLPQTRQALLFVHTYERGV